MPAGLLHGDGTLSTTREDPLFGYSEQEYEGQFHKGVKHGTGAWMEGSSGIRYRGEWADDMFNGQGSWNNTQGDTYEGTFQNSKKHGVGTWGGVNHERYEGEWTYDMFNGQGKWALGDETRYEGGWKMGKKHGQGVYSGSNGEVRGVYSNPDIRVTGSNGEVYEGGGMRLLTRTPTPTLTLIGGVRGGVA